MRLLSSSRRGSALLVVLGMLAFMVVSGLAFSVFMRSTRLPSSFTRRTVATRQLAKAALAEAIDQIDRSVANDPHPNIRRGTSTDNYNYWLGRVLMAADTTSGTRKMPNEVVSELRADPNENGCSETVPVLTLEALAYLPPSLINEARYYGQRTATAAWQSMSFDAGRYAFIALDVSDYFDVNRILADEARSSNPSCRVTLGHLFENADHTSASSGADAWGTFMDQFRTIQDDGTFQFGSKVPLVSLGDFNLALGSQSPGGLKSPFVQYLKSGGSGDGFCGAPGDADFEKYAEMTFVADSLDAPLGADELKTEGGLAILDLDDESNQPFTDTFLEQAQGLRRLDAVWHQSSKTLDRFLGHGVPQVAICALSDYLDCDRIPISLGMPSVERVPMICGIKPTVAESVVNVAVKCDASAEATTVSGGGPDDEEKIVKKTVHWRLDPGTFRELTGGGAGVNVLAVYPFRNHEKASESGFYKMDGKMQFFLSTVNMPLRADGRSGLLHIGADTTEHLTQGNVQSLCKTAKLVGRAVFEFPLQEKSIDIPYDSITKPEDCVKLVELALDRSSSASLINSELKDDQGDILRVTYQWKQTPIKDKDGKITDWKPKFDGQIPVFGTADADVKILTSGGDAPAASFLPLDGSGAVDTKFLGNIKADSATEISLYLNMAVTVRVKSSDTTILGAASGTKTLDLVPATAYDDEILNDVKNGNSRMANLGGSGTPLMKFIGVEGKINTQSEDASFAAESSPKSVMISDPRYNYAPENWVERNFSGDNDWYDNLAKAAAAANDGDIFMASSDQGYMQSIYELAFLPRFSDLRTFADELRGNLGTYDGGSRTKLGTGTLPDANLMWKTYDIVGRYNADPDDFEGLGLENLGRGLRVNPYSDSTNVVMAAFANAPHDWRVASDPSDAQLKMNPSSGFDVQAFNKKHAWNEYSSGAKLAWEDLELVAGAFMNRVSACARNNDGTWQDALSDIFDQQRAEDTEQYLCGIQLESPSDKLYSVDKKFLCGYWRNCFAARQQLFLVFFRAEPMMLGGGVAGVTPPQLGAKGVAVVWRDPNRTTGSEYGYMSNGSIETDYRPHPTRILFYRQFE